MTSDATATDTAHGEDWDARYAEQDHLWSGDVNGALVAELTGATPGRALDVGCGEGADAVWLAQQGWQVTAVDVSQVALDRARAVAADAGVEVDFVRADVVAAPPSAGGYDLVSVHYPALAHAPDDEAIEALLAPVAPGGTLLVVGHALRDVEHALAHGFDPADLVQPTDVAAHLGDGWEVEVHETRPRAGVDPHDAHRSHDTVLRARRRR